MYQSVASNIIEYFHYAGDNLYLLADEAYTELAGNIKQLHGNAEIRVFQTGDPDHLNEVFDLPHAIVVLLLAQPETYVKYRLFQYLDFSEGEPQIPNTVSRVLIFPVESICRMFAGDVSSNHMQRQKLLDKMKPHHKYRVTSEQGTDLVFETRNWIPLDFEVCTAPIEASVNGVIVVDGAVFFKKIENTLTFVIKDGKIIEIKAGTEQGMSLVAEYTNMTAGVMKDTVNMQLAEIGIGFCSGAVISDCFMEAETVLNTCHFCFGNNVCYGGVNESEFHGASVLIKNPVFTCIN